MVDEVPDRDAFCELRQAAIVIAVPMGDDQVVDPGQACVLGCYHDALGIADRSRRRHIAGVDQEGFAGWRHQQRSVAAFGVDHIDVQSRARLRRGAVWSRLGDQRQGSDGCQPQNLAHGNPPCAPDRAPPYSPRLQGSA